MNINLKTFLPREPNGYISDILNIEKFYNVPDKSGIYIIISQKERFIYPKDKSSVIYIGMAKNLKKRLLTHHRNVKKMASLTNNNRISAWHYSRYQYIRSFGGKLFWLTTRGTQEAKNLESHIIEKFYDRYLALPVGNGAFSFPKIK